MEITIDFPNASPVETFRKFNPNEGVEKYDSLQQITDVIKRRPLLTRVEEIALAKRIERGDETARTKMIESNLRLVLRIAFRHRNKGLPIEDLIQEGVIGLIRACDLFDWRRGNRFSTYAVHWISQTIQRSVEDKASIIRIPSRYSRILGKVMWVRDQFFQEHCREATNEEVSSRIGYYEGAHVTPKLISHCESALVAVVSTDQFICGHEEIPILELIADEAILGEEMKFARTDIAKILSRYLSERELEIILFRIGVYDNRVFTYREIAKIIGLSRTRINQIEGEALEKIRGCKELLAQLN